MPTMKHAKKPLSLVDQLNVAASSNWKKNDSTQKQNLQKKNRDLYYNYYL